MKIQSSKEFIDKLDSYKNSRLVEKFQFWCYEVLRQGKPSQLKNTYHCDSNGICTLYIEKFCLFFVVEHDFVVFMDITTIPKNMNIRKMHRNPTFNHSINPTFNHSINPTFNHSINPTFNHSINPTFNHSINPTFNHSINPTFNHSINPTFNHSINPTFNHSINPTFNHSINPTFNADFIGFYLFEVSSMFCVYYAIPALLDESVYLVYDSDSVCVFFAVKNSEGYTLFEYDSRNYVGYWVGDGKTGFNQYDTLNKWKMFIK